MTEEIIDRSDVERILTDSRFRVPEADASATGPADRFRAGASRFTNGVLHDERRRRLEALLAQIDPDALAAAATSSTRAIAPADADQVAAHVPVACLAAELGFDEPESLPPLVAVLAAHYPQGGPSDAADAAAARLIAAAPAASEHDDDAVFRVQLLVQAYAATGGLVVGAMRRLPASEASASTSELLGATLRDAPPVQQTRRVAPDGSALVLHFDGPDREAPHDEPRTLAFGAGSRACPASRHAVAIAAAIVEELRAC
jgi:hypothetical protein